MRTFHQYLTVRLSDGRLVEVPKPVKIRIPTLPAELTTPTGEPGPMTVFPHSPGGVQHARPAPILTETDLAMTVTNALAFFQNAQCRVLLARFVEVDNATGKEICGDQEEPFHGCDRDLVFPEPKKPQEAKVG